MPLKPHTAFGMERIHVHRLAAVTPARRDGERNADSFARKFFRARRSFGHAADAGVGDDAFHGFSRSDNAAWRSISRRPCHVHGLFFERFAHAARRPSIVGRMPILGSEPLKTESWLIRLALRGILPPSRRSSISSVGTERVNVGLNASGPQRDFVASVGSSDRVDSN